MSALNVPTAFFTGGHDFLADPKDVANLMARIKSTLVFAKNISSYEHLDFIWGINANQLVYDEIIQQISVDLEMSDNKRYVL